MFAQMVQGQFKRAALFRGHCIFGEHGGYLMVVLCRRLFLRLQVGLQTGIQIHGTLGFDDLKMLTGVAQARQQTLGNRHLRF